MTVLATHLLIFRPRPTAHPDLLYLAGAPCTIVRELTRAEVDAVLGPMFEVTFPEVGTTIHAFGDELVIPVMAPGRDVDEAADRLIAERLEREGWA